MPRPRRRPLEQMEKDAQAADYFRQGMNYRDIAKQMGWNSPASAHKAVKRAVADSTKDPFAAAEAMALMLERIQDRRRRLWEIADSPHFLATPAGVIVTTRDEETGRDVPVLDNGPTVRALVAMRQDDELEATLRDLRPATKKVVEVITEDVVDANIRAIRDRLAALGALPPELGGARLALPAYPGARGEDRAPAHLAGGGEGRRGGTSRQP